MAKRGPQPTPVRVERVVARPDRPRRRARRPCERTCRSGAACRDRARRSREQARPPCSTPRRRLAADDGWAVIRAQGRVDRDDAGVRHPARPPRLARGRRRRRTPPWPSRSVEQVLGARSGRTRTTLRLRRDVHQWLLALDARTHRCWWWSTTCSGWTRPRGRCCPSSPTGSGRPRSLVPARRPAPTPHRPGLDDQPVLHLSAARPDRRRCAPASGTGRASSPLARASDHRTGGRQPAGAARAGPAQRQRDAAGHRRRHARPGARSRPRSPPTCRPAQPAPGTCCCWSPPAADDLTVLARAVGPAERSPSCSSRPSGPGLVRVVGQQVVFRHPLIESTDLRPGQQPRSGSEAHARPRRAVRRRRRPARLAPGGGDRPARRGGRGRADGQRGADAEARRPAGGRRRRRPRRRAHRSTRTCATSGSSPGSACRRSSATCTRSPMLAEHFRRQLHPSRSSAPGPPSCTPTPSPRPCSRPPPRTCCRPRSRS